MDYLDNLIIMPTDKLELYKTKEGDKMTEEQILQEIKNIRLELKNIGSELKKIGNDISSLTIQATTLNDIDSDLEEILKEIKSQKTKKN